MAVVDDTVPVLRRRWVVADPAPAAFLAMCGELPPIIAQLLFHRGVQEQARIDAFLRPDYVRDLHDPFAFHGMGKAVDRIARARDAGERILVHGDYDADGVSGAAILSETLEAIGCGVDVFIPHRERDGYGFTNAGLAYARERECRVIITCDCGISNAPTVEVARTAGIDVIVTDHHLIPTDPTSGAPMLPSAFAILHPKIPGETYPFDGLTGGGVAFKLCQAIVARDAASASPRLAPGFEKWLLDCVAISTVADFGPLVGENRALVTYGLVVLGKTRRLGLRSLYEVAGIRPDRITPATIGFQIAPRINVAGRLDHANEAFRLLRTSDPVEGKSLAAKLHATNAERQRLVEEACREAFRQVLPHTGDDTENLGREKLLHGGGSSGGHVLLVVGDDWLPGIVGLIATKLRDRTNRPALAITRHGGKIVGSGRSIEGFHILDALRSTPESFAAFGGHPQACGFTVADEVALAALPARLDAYAREHLTEELLVPTLRIDAELDLADVAWPLVEALDALEPFGVGNPTPRFLARGVIVDGVRTMGRDGQHLRLVAHQPRESQDANLGVRSRDSRSMVCFRYQDICAAIRTGDILDIVYEVDVNEWNGNREIQIKIVDARPAEAGALR